MIIVTGAAGFIGSCLVRKLNDSGHTDLILVDEFSREDKNRNLANKQFSQQIDRSEFLDWFRANYALVEVVFHMGARTDTTEQDLAIFETLNLGYSKALWGICAQRQIPLIYASSAATYGLGELGYDDRHDIVPRLHPLNPYGQSKNDFDEWVLTQPTQPPFWAGLKFFNVYGPNEYHKGRMASVIFHTLRQIKATGGMKLFRSHRPDFKDGAQSRDFVYVKDVTAILYWLWQQQPENGLYNLGTGQARTFLDLATHTFLAMNLKPNIQFIDTPADIRDTYQYFTEANMAKLREAGYQAAFYTLEAGIADYVGQYLKEELVY
ncbi:MAG TPA: ADP-glyceromanno-heptose 6-epimerase [Saprospiraceae bacterium]|nr:ADP-glyceromanno-heptose 6-epimerase [Saprospiraceae bacterium]HMQ84659.1 ADP-glyceromanno-heptose 6-epimerase [Saprospiraceae bacterium]